MKPNDPQAEAEEKDLVVTFMVKPGGTWDRKAALDGSSKPVTRGLQWVSADTSIPGRSSQTHP